MKLSCPYNDKHKKFSVTAHIAQEWQVGRDGDFIKIITDCTDIVYRPDKDVLFICTACGATAHVE